MHTCAAVQSAICVVALNQRPRGGNHRSFVRKSDFCAAVNYA